MSNITYYLGAGASCKALPMVKDLPSKFDEVINFLSNENVLLSESEDFVSINGNPSKRVIQNTMIEDLVWLKEQSSKHATIDTFAKKLHIKGSLEDLRRLKAVLVIFFSVMQLRDLSTDYRYDSFFASIFKASPTIPENIRIVSWNYDLQLEIALSDYTDSKNITLNSERLSSIFKGAYFHENDKYKCFKLNGIAAYLSSEYQFNITPGYDYSDDKYFVENLAKSYGLMMTKQLYSAISFAWENEHIYMGKTTSICDLTSKNVFDTDILVVVGYSFPFFNRDIDRMVIGGMNNLRKVYIQDPNARKIMDRFQSIKEMDRSRITLIEDDTDQFFLPHEL